MLAKTITESDAFLDMPQSSQNLYFHLNMNADDDGFVNNPKKIQRTVGSSEDDLKILLAKSFLIPFESGVVVIKHWRIHNYIRSDRYKPTSYIEEKNRLAIKENGAYTMAPIGIPNDIPNVPQCETQIRIGEDRIGEDRKREEPVFSKTEALNPNRSGISQEVESDRHHWNDIGAKPPKEKLIMNFDGITPTIQAYTRERRHKAMDNYEAIRKSTDHELRPEYGSLDGFLREGVEKYVDEADPWTRCKKKQPAGIKKPEPVYGFIDDEEDFSK